jgi:ubiquinone/menaquinone biosynthesis C-methylase UbiE
LEGVVPKMGRVVAKERENYEYFPDSVRRFPKPRRLGGHARRKRDLQDVRYMITARGLIGVHTGVVPA